MATSHKLTEEQKRSILAMRREGKTFKAIAAMFNVSEMACYYAEQKLLLLEGRTTTVFRTETQDSRLDYGTIYRDKSRHTPFSELFHTDTDDCPTWFKAGHNSFVCDTERALDRIVGELDASNVSPATWERIAGLQAEMQSA